MIIFPFPAGVLPKPPKKAKKLVPVLTAFFKMNNNPIVFFDSGLGGLPYLEWARTKMPKEYYIYCADTLNFPYGNKSDEQIKNRVLESVSRAHSLFKPKVIVIACNTASVVALSALRANLPVPFVGVVPAVKPAAKISAGKKFGLLATSRTVEEAYTDNLIQTFASDCSVLRFAGTELVNFVEKEYLDSSTEQRKDALNEIVQWCGKYQFDTLVLGCTHFVYLINELKQQLPPGIKIIDSREGVVNQLIRIIAGIGRRSNEKRGELFITGGLEDDSIYRRFSGLYNLDYRGTI